MMIWYGTIGLLACGVTHCAITPMDLVKTNAQVNKEVFPGAIAGMRAIYSGSVRLFTSSSTNQPTHVAQ
jgi:hypothetical protein